MLSSDLPVVDVRFFFAVADRSFRRVEKADGLAGSQYNLLVIVFNTLSTYVVKRIQHSVPLVTQRGAQ